MSENTKGVKSVTLLKDVVVTGGKHAKKFDTVELAKRDADYLVAEGVAADPDTAEGKDTIATKKKAAASKDKAKA